MFEIKEKFSLKKHNTFSTNVKCSYYVECFTVNDIKDFLDYYKQQDSPLLILGGGSNILFTDDFAGFVVKPCIKGIEIIEETEDVVIVKAGAGEEWDDFVAYCVEKNWGGIENLSLIPGKVGASPIQNIGAYGVEVKDVLLRAEALEISTGKLKSFSKEDCKLGYRDSIFKNTLRGKFVITHVTFRLSKKPVFNTSYGNLNNEVKKYGELNLQNIRRSVVDIRNSKLPKVEEVGNAGSFFKNPVINVKEANVLKSTYPEMPIYEQENGLVKIPAGWLIEKAGWKGKRKGDVGVHDKQALVLINYNDASGNEILHFARNIQQSILILFGINLEIEVNVI